jgi:hypothetical protein
VLVYAKHGEVDAAIGFVVSASYTCSTAEIRNKGKGFSGNKSGRIALYKLGCKLVTQYPGILKKWLGTFKGMEVSATDSYSFNF